MINWHMQETRCLLTTASTTNMLTDAKRMNCLLDKGLRKTTPLSKYIPNSAARGSD